MVQYHVEQYRSADEKGKRSMLYTLATLHPKILGEVYDELRKNEIPEGWTVHYNWFHDKKEVLNPVTQDGQRYYSELLNRQRELVK